MGICSCTARFVLFIFNLAWALLGLAILGIGIYMNIQGKTFREVLDGQLTVSTILLIVVGGSVFLIAFFGCCGAIREDPCCLNTYGVILSAILLCQVAVGVIAFVYKNQVQTSLNNYIEKEFLNATRGDQESINIVNGIQKDIKCCGLDGPNYWIKHSSEIPPSCCGGKSSCTANDAFSDGCKDKAVTTIVGFLYIMGIAAIAVGVVELLGVIFAFCLASSIKRREMRGYA
uniref:Tetraspanin n=1 Tax=Riptortus pedestris TaxID=329032 RepID=R4WRU5_RIPPE|nr:tetraspanin, putative [Riptortus pedestris]